MDLAELTVSKVTPEDGQRIKDAFSFFAQFLVEWNLEEEDGTPIPCTPDGLLAQEYELVIAIINAWVSAVHNVSPSLKERSNDGMRSVVESIPMETLSESLPNLLGQN